MSDHFIARNCAPTLAGLKTGSMFSAAYTDRRELDAELRELNRLLVKYGLRVTALKYSERRALIYLYRPDDLERDLRDPLAAEILSERGYRQENADSCVAELVRQFRCGEEFPHEVGLFLGYPPEDVRGFMRDPHAGYQCVGFWKVYGDREAAEKTFTRYRSCTKTYCRATAKGKKLDDLIVGTKHA